MEQVTGILEGGGQWLSDKVMAMINAWFPPEKRAEWLMKIKAWTVKHPKVAAFLLTNTALSGFPLFLFILFGLTIFTFALIVGLIVGLVIAVLFSLSAIGIALMFLFPVIFFTTLTAVFIFLMGMAGYWIFKKFNQGGVGAPGDRIGDKLNSLTGGKLDFLMGQANEAQSEKMLGPAQETWSKGPSGYFGGQQNGTAKNNDEPEHAPKKAQSNGTPKKSENHGAHSTGSDAKGHVGNATNGVKKNLNADGVSNGAGHVTKTAGLGDTGDKVTKAPKKLNSTVGTVKGTATGGLGGATGLT